MNRNDITKRAEIADMIERSAAMGCGHMAQLLRPVMDRRMNLIVPRRDTRMPPLHRLGKLGLPLAVLVGDDDYRPAGPSTWASADKLRSWANFAIVHGTGAHPDHYALAAEMTIQTGRLLMIETSSAAAQDWAGFLQERAGLRYMGILPPDGTHPVTPAKGSLH